jgi:tagatose 1,6-diphosphate aldolase
MAQLKISKKKLDNLQTCSNDRGVIAAAAMDQRGSLENALNKAGDGHVGAEQMGTFKTAVTEILTPHATAVLLDPLYGLEASRQRAGGTGLLLAYEESGYDISTPGRLPEVLGGWSVRRLAEAGANAVKVLLYYNPQEGEEVNEQKHAFIERVGAECESVGLPFFLEPVTYDDGIANELEFARRKPDYVSQTMAEFSKDRYGVDILKVEFPFNAKYTGGLAAEGDVAYSREEAMRHAKDAADATDKPFIYLSAGVDMSVFLASLELVGEAGVPFSGVLCGRATWKGGIPVFAQQGESALRSWLAGEGVDNIEKLNALLDKSATPWWDRYGGLEGLVITDPS